MTQFALLQKIFHHGKPGKANAVLFSNHARSTNFLNNVIFCDIALPDTDGCSLLSTVITSTDHSWKRIPAIAMTAFCDSKTQQQALEVGFQPYFIKPVDLDELISTVADLAPPKEPV